MGLIRNQRMSTEMAGCNIIINYLPSDANEEEIRDLFEAFGKVTSVRLIRNKETGASLCYGFVVMDNELEGQVAIDALNQKVLRDKIMKVSRAKTKEEVLAGGDNTNVYITNVCPEVNSDILTRCFIKFGPIVSTHIVRNRDPSLKGVAFVKFFERDDADRAIKEQNGRPMCIRDCTSRCTCTEIINCKFAIPSSAKFQKQALGMGMIRPGIPGMYNAGPMNLISALPPANGPLSNTSMPNYGYATGHLQTFITPSTINSYFPAMAAPVANQSGAASNVSNYQYTYPYQYPYYNTQNGSVSQAAVSTSLAQYSSTAGGYTAYATAAYPANAYSQNTQVGYQQHNQQTHNQTQQTTPQSYPQAYQQAAYQQQYQSQPSSYSAPVAATPPLTINPAAAMAMDPGTNLALGTHCVFVYGLAQATTEEELQALFLPYGAISNARLCYEITDGKRSCKGFGFVNYYSFNDAQLAIAGLNNFNYKGHVLQVRFKSSKGGKG